MMSKEQRVMRENAELETFIYIDDGGDIEKNEN